MSADKQPPPSDAVTIMMYVRIQDQGRIKVHAKRCRRSVVDQLTEILDEYEARLAAKVKNEAYWDQHDRVLKGENP